MIRPMIPVKRSLADTPRQIVFNVVCDLDALSSDDWRQSEKNKSEDNCKDKTYDDLLPL